MEVTDASKPPRRDGLLAAFKSLLLHFLPEREWPDEQNYLSGLWRDCDFTACVCRSISVVKDFFRAEVLQFQPRIASSSWPTQHIGSIDSEGLIVFHNRMVYDDRTVVLRVGDVYFGRIHREL
jgi:hypothetical protein